MPTLRPNSPYFLVRIAKKAAEERKEKIGDLFINPNGVAMTRNMQHGEIVGISQRAGQNFPEAKLGQTLIFHHFVEGMDNHDASDNHLVDSDESYFYYVVTPIAFNGKRNEVYGVWNGEAIIAHPDYVFLEADKKTEIADDTPDEFLNKAIEKTSSGLIVFKEWKESREEKTARMTAIKAEIQELSSKNKMTPQLRNVILEKEEEMNKISMEINTKTYAPYKIAFAPAILNDWFSRKVKAGDILYMLNSACETYIEFKGTEYRVAETKYIGFMVN